MRLFSHDPPNPTNANRNETMKALTHTQLSETLGLSERRDGFWLYDKTRGMNLAMRAKTRDSAFVEALTYYQNRLKQVEGEFKDMSAKVEAFVTQFREDDNGF